eukprot:3507130-Rhodomonas_salina.1
MLLSSSWQLTAGQPTAGQPTAGQLTEEPALHMPYDLNIIKNIINETEEEVVYAISEPGDLCGSLYFDHFRVHLP